MNRMTFSSTRLGRGSFLEQGMVFRMPHTRPMTTPMAVATTARIRVFFTPLR